MDSWYKSSPTCKLGQGSSRNKQQIIIPIYDNELVPGGGPATYRIQEKGTAIKIRRNEKSPHNQYPMHNTIKSPKLPCKNNLRENPPFIIKESKQSTPTMQMYSVR